MDNLSSLLKKNEADDATQAARIAAVKGKKVLFLTTYLAATLYKQRDKALFNLISSWGPELYFVFGKTENDKQGAEMFKKDGIVTGILWVDMEDADTACGNIIAAVRASGIKFDAVFSPYEHAMPLVGTVAKSLGIYENPPCSYQNARNKTNAREICTNAGIPTPKFAKIQKRTDISAAVEHIGFPLVLKPSTGACSEGVYLCQTIGEVYKRFDQVNTELTTDALLSWAPECGDIFVLLEEYVDGKEFDVDVIMYDSRAVYSNVIDNASCPEPYFLETGSVCPSVCSETWCKQLRDYSAECIRALGFVRGLFHVEVKYSMRNAAINENGEIIGQPLLIEVNPRMGGGRTRKFHMEVYGVDIFENFFLTACGIPVNPPRAVKPKCCLGEYEICAEKTGVLLHTRFLDHIKTHPNVTEVTVYKKAGDFVKGMDTGIPEWVGLYMVRADTAKEVSRLISEIFGSISPPIVPPATDKVNETSSNDIMAGCNVIEV